MNGKASYFGKATKHQENNNEKEKSKREGHKELKMLVWNVAGLEEKNEKKWDYIKSFEIINLTKTWITKEKEKMIRNKLKDFNLEMTEARKDKRKGRAKGGIIFGTTKGLVEEQEILKKTEEIVAVRIRNKQEARRIIITYMRDKREENWRIIKDILEDNERLGTMIGGDFNARIGEEEGWTEEEEYFGLRDDQERGERRASKDKVLNAEGKSLINKVKENGLFIANGSINGDEEGEFTYIGTREKTTMDYLLLNGNGKSLIKKMIIGERIDSDHTPLEITWNKEIIEIKAERKEIIDWSDKGIKESERI